MNLMTQAAENIYKYGNTTLYIKKYNARITFVAEEDGKLSIKVDNNYNDELMCDSFELDVKEGLPHIAYLLFYSYADSARKNDLAYLTTEKEDKSQEVTIVAVNELYKQLIPMLSVDRDYIEVLAKSCNTLQTLYATIANSAKYIDNNDDDLSIKHIMKLLTEKYNNFEKILYKASSLWVMLGNQDSEDSNITYNKWNELLNQLYIEELSEPTKIDLNSIDISYEFLTSKHFLSNPAVGCDEELENLEIAILTPSKSAVLVGPPGVGKTAIVEGLSYLIRTKQAPHALQGKKILKINTSSIVKGCSLVGMFEEKVEKIMQYLIENPDVILFVDELHTAIGAGVGSKGNLDLANLMKPYIDRDQIKVIGATTDEEYEEYIKSDKAFNRRFKKVNIKEPQKSKVCEIIKETIKKLEKTTNINWNFETGVSEIVINHIAEITKEKNRVYNDKRFNPDISLTILETSFAIALLNENQNISVENIADAIRKSEFLYEGVRTKAADELLSECHIPRHAKCKILNFPTPLNYQPKN